MAKAKSKRQTSSQRHKVERKIREHKRDVRRAAKAMKETGLKVRSKKSRETAKLALRVSNSNPNKEAILTGFIAAREAAKKEKAERRQAVREGKTAVALRDTKNKARDAELETDDDASVGAGASSDDDDEGGAEGAEARYFKRSRAELAEAGETRLTAKQVAERERQQRRKDAAAAATAKQQQAISQHLLIPAGEHVGNPHLQFGKVVDRLAKEVPAFVVVVDARCPVQSAPWDQIDGIVSAAVVERDRLAALEAAAAAAKASPKKAAAASPASKKAGRRSAAAAAAEEEAPAAAAAATATRTSASVQRLVCFVLNKAELVPMEALALGYSHLSEAVADRYGDILAPAALPVATTTATNATAPVSFTALPHSAVVDASAKTILRALRQFHQDFVQPFDAETVATSNMKGKLGACVIGLPGTGKTTFCRCVQTQGTDSVVSTVPCRTIRTAHAKDAPQSADEKVIVPGAKQLTLVTIADDEQLKAMAITAGDAIFHSTSRIEKMKEPEQAAILLAESFKDQTALCQALSLPAMPTAAAFLKAFGRCIIRERGYQPSGIFSGSAGSLSSSALTASDAQGAAQFIAGLKRVHVRRRHDDGRNPLRVGARTFLHAFHEGQHVVWAVKRQLAADDEAKPKSAEEAAETINAFVPLFVPKQVAQTLSAEGTEAAALPAIKAAPGAVQLMVLQHALKDCMALLPHKCLEVDPAAVLPPSLDELSDDDDDEEDDEQLEMDDEEEEEEADGDDADDDDAEEDDDEEGDDEEDDEESDEQ